MSGSKEIEGFGSFAGSIKDLHAQHNNCPLGPSTWKKLFSIFEFIKVQLYLYVSLCYCSILNNKTFLHFLHAGYCQV